MKFLKNIYIILNLCIIQTCFYFSWFLFNLSKKKGTMFRVVEEFLVCCFILLLLFSLLYHDSKLRDVQLLHVVRYEKDRLLLFTSITTCSGLIHSFLRHLTFL